VSPVDWSTMTAAEIQQALTEGTAAWQAAQRSDQDAEAALRVSIGQAEAALVALLGPKDAAPGTGSIRAVAAHSDATIAQNQAIFNRLVVNCLATMAETTRDLARVVGSLD